MRPVGLVTVVVKRIRTLKEAWTLDPREYSTQIGMIGSSLVSSLFTLLVAYLLWGRSA